MTRWVLLKHSTSDGAWHFDWLLERPSGWSGNLGGQHAGGGGGLISFRIFERPDDPGVSAFLAERIAEHRAAYLTYEGPISGGRGRVERVSHGTCAILRDDDELWVNLLEPFPRRFIGVILSGDGIGYSFRLA